MSEDESQLERAHRWIAKIRDLPFGEERLKKIIDLHAQAEDFFDWACQLAVLTEELEVLASKLEFYRLPAWARQLAEQRMNEIFEVLSGDYQEHKRNIKFVRTSSDYVEDPVTGRIRKATKQ